MVRSPTWIPALSVVGLVVIGCGGEITRQDLKEARQAAFERGQDRGYKQGLERAREEARATTQAARDAGFLQGARYALDCITGEGDGPLYTGYVRVTGIDHFGLDRDGNGFGCEG